VTQKVCTFSYDSENRRTSTSVIAARPCACGGNEIAAVLTTISSRASGAKARRINSGRLRSLASM